MSSPSLDFGACPNPGINYNSSESIFTPSNTEQFPFDSSSDIATLESAICDRLRSDDCDAGLDAIIVCDGARWLYSGYAGQQAADAWNEALGVEGSGGDGNDVGVVVTTAAETDLLTSSTWILASEASPSSTSPSSEETSSSSSEPPLTLTSATTTLEPQSTIPSSTTVARTTRTTTASSTARTTSSSSSSTSGYDDSSNGSPFGYQNAASTSIPRKPLSSTRTVLGLATTLILFFASLPPSLI